MKRVLIVNADDCNLTRGVTEAIFDCHDHGILTSTTFMINLPVERKTVKEIKKRRTLGVGLHMNVTFQKPVSKPGTVRSLLGAGNVFRKVGEQTSKLPRLNELLREYQAQIDLYKKIFGSKPTHLDTHHQTHDHPFFLRAVLAAAARNKIPVRRSKLMLRADFQKPKVQSTDFFFGNLTTEGYWRAESLETVLRNLPYGVSEIMCHPGKNDAALAKVSSFRRGRAVEYGLFRSPAFRRQVQSQGITLSHFGLCYTY